MRLLLDRRFLATAFSHLMVDTINGQRVILLTFFSVMLGLNNTTLGTISMTYLLVASLSQPLFGLLSDRIGVRWLAVGGPLWIGILFSIAVLLPPWPAIVLLILASIGSAAFHPAGTAHSTLLGRSRLAGQETTAASLFFFFGQTGFFLGPIVGGFLLSGKDPSMLVVVGVATVLVGLFTLQQLWTQGSIAPEKKGKEKQLAIKVTDRIGGLPFLALIVVAVTQSWSQQNMITFVPKYLSDLGQAPSFYGPMAALFMGGSGIGNVIGGLVADRIGKKWVVVAGMGLATLPFFFYSSFGASSWLYLVTPLAGFLNGATYSVAVVLAQRLIPGGMGFASGLAMGFIFSAGAIGAAASGMVADAINLPAVFFLSAGLAAIGSLMGFFLKEPKLEVVPAIQTT